jgi:hypothetical protein
VPELDSTGMITLRKLHDNLESKRRQYALADRAGGLGWQKVPTIDDELGWLEGSHHTLYCLDVDYARLNDRRIERTELTALCGNRVTAAVTTHSGRNGNFRNRRKARARAISPRTIA